MNDVSYLCSIERVSKWRRNLPQILAVTIKNVMLIAFGMTLGFPTVLIPGLISSKEFTLTADDTTWLGSVNLICVPIGCIFSGHLSQRFGRKRMMQVLNVPLFGVWLLFRFSTHLWQVYMGLAFLGILHGTIEAPIISYVSEITTPQLRGVLSSTANMSTILGILVQFLLGTFYPWRHCALISSIFPIVALNLLGLVPESPRWLLHRQQQLVQRHNPFTSHRPAQSIAEYQQRAKASLCWLRGWVTPASVDREFAELQKELTRPGGGGEPGASCAGAVTSKWRQRQFLQAFGLVVAVFFLQQFSGITNVQTYAVELFATFEAPIDAYYSTMILGVANVVGCIFSVSLVHFCGKRILNFLSLFLCLMFAILVGVYAYYHNILTLNLTGGHPSDLAGNIKLSHWIPTGALIAFSFFNHMGIRILPWILTGEVFAPNTRSVACGLASAANYLFAFASNKSFLVLVDLLTLPGMFALYAGVLLVALVFLYFCLPETEGKALAEIYDHFAGVKELDNEVGRKDDTLSNNDHLWYVNFDLTDSVYFNLETREEQNCMMHF